MLNSIYLLEMEELPVELKGVPEDIKTEHSEIEQPKVKTEAVQHTDKVLGRSPH